MDCFECLAQCEEIRASYHVTLVSGSEIDVCDTHLDILTTEGHVSSHSIILWTEGTES